MVEVNPRPRSQSPLVQIVVALISGAAGMYCLQTFRAAADSSAAAARKNSHPIEAGETPPRPVEAPRPAAPAPAVSADDSSRFKPAPPAAVSMMVVPEPGGVSGGVVAVGDDVPAPPAAAPAAETKAEAGEAPAAEAKPPVIHLQESGLQSRYVGSIGHGFNAPALSPHVFAKPKKAAAKAAPPPAAPPKPAPHYMAVARNLDEKGIPQKDVFVPSLLHPEDLPDEEFWTYDRKRKAVLAGIIALSGVFYFMFALGWFQSLVAKPRYEDERIL
jgi:hypothetical protein